MEVKVQSKKIGQGYWSTKTIILPDHVAPYFEKYSLDIIESPEYQCMSLYFHKKGGKGEDVWSYTIHRPSIHENIVHGFKTAFEELAELERKSDDVQPDQTH